jgi:hypothetical protein
VVRFDGFIVKHHDAHIRRGKAELDQSEIFDDRVILAVAAIGLISPAAGEGSEGTAPRVIFVRSVQRLGALLAEGYSAIVIDLNEGVSEEEQEMAMAQ